MKILRPCIVPVVRAWTTTIRSSKTNRKMITVFLVDIIRTQLFANLQTNIIAIFRPTRIPLVCVTAQRNLYANTTKRTDRSFTGDRTIGILNAKRETVENSARLRIQILYGNDVIVIVPLILLLFHRLDRRVKIFRDCSTSL